MVTWMLTTNFLALVTPLIDTIQRKCQGTGFRATNFFVAKKLFVQIICA